MYGSSRETPSKRRLFVSYCWKYSKSPWIWPVQIAGRVMKIKVQETRTRSAYQTSELEEEKQARQS